MDELDIAEYMPSMVTTLRVERPDGSATEVAFDDDGSVTSTRFRRDGAIDSRVLAEVSATGGGVVVTQHDASGEVKVVAPVSRQQQINPYGAIMEHADYDVDLAIESTFNDDGDLWLVGMNASWGEQEVELRPDGARIVRWKTILHEGSKHWNASGHLDHFEVSYPDRSSYRWDRIDDIGRQVIVGWDGQTDLSEQEIPPDH